jgi:hypothetical protein
MEETQHVCDSLMTCVSIIGNDLIFNREGKGTGVWCGSGAVTKTKPSPTLFITNIPGSGASFFLRICMCLVKPASFCLVPLSEVEALFKTEPGFTGFRSVRHIGI